MSMSLYQGESSLRMMMLRFLISIFVISQNLISAGEFQTRHTHPIALTPDGKRLLVVNSPGASLSVFDISDATRVAPLLVGEISVGLSPVSVRARTDDEVWVVNEVSDSVSIISLSEMTTTQTLQVPDEPADVIFSGGKAFVSCAGNLQLAVHDAISHGRLGTIPLAGVSPRAMAVNADGSRLYVAFLLSGNNSTILPRELAPQPPPPTNPALPLAPKTALIVPASDTRVASPVADHDIAEINTATLVIQRYLPSVGTHLFDLQVHPASGELWVANSESDNITRFEPALRGQFSSHRLSVVATVGPATPRHYDLNPGIPRALTPVPSSLALALAQPTAVVLSATGDRAWVAAFNSDRVAEIDTLTGGVLGRVDVRVGSASVRGPRGLALSQDGQRLFVLNSLSNSVSVISTVSRTLLVEVPTASRDDTSATSRLGRGSFFDARLSGNGTISCATCHLDADRDGLAWDLGDPGGSLTTVAGANLSAHQNGILNRILHPMKGPMVTQSLIGLAADATSVTSPAAAVTQKFHWRGDKPTLQSFNPTFPDLLGGNLLPPAEIDALAAYLLSLQHHPNPHENADGSLPTSLQGGNAVIGRAIFENDTVGHCAACHTSPSGTNQNLDLRREVGGSQDVKTPSLRTTYQRAGLASLSGFGLGSDGTGSSTHLPHFYQLDNLITAQQVADLTAYLLSFSTGTSPAVGRTLTTFTPGAAAEVAAISLLETQAAAGECALVVRAKFSGESRRFHFDPASQMYRADRASDGFLSRASLIAGAVEMPVTFLGVLPTDGQRLGGDADMDGILDGDEPLPALAISVGNHEVRVPRWQGISPKLAARFSHHPPFSGSATPASIFL
jgi:DNA-binding beta-propeller fold protein YncE